MNMNLLMIANFTEAGITSGMKTLTENLDQLFAATKNPPQEDLTIRIKIAGMGMTIYANLPWEDVTLNDYDLLAKGLLEISNNPLSEITFDQRRALEHVSHVARRQAQAVRVPNKVRQNRQVAA